MKIYLLSIVILALLQGCPTVYPSSQFTPSSTSNSLAPMPQKPGACYAKCLIEDKVVLSETVYPIFTGNPENTEIALDTVDHVKKEAGTTWIKKKVEEGCKAKNKEDCLVWCLVEVPEEIETIVVVRDPSTTNEYNMVSMAQFDTSEAGGSTQWKEVVCDNHITKGLIFDLQTVLTEETQVSGFKGEIDGEMNPETRTALVNYQKVKGLPVGQLDFETLNELGIKY